MKQFKAFLVRHRGAVMGSVISSMFMLMTVAGASSATPSFDLATTMTSAVNTIVTNLLSMIAAVLPPVITLIGASIGISYAITFIKSLMGKSRAS